VIYAIDAIFFLNWLALSLIGLRWNEYYQQNLNYAPLFCKI